MRKILFFGDSLTAGYGLRDADKTSYPSLIGWKIKEAGLHYKVVNAGLSGDTSAGGLRRLGYWLTESIDVFILELGINDLARRIPPSTTFQNLQAIIRQVQSKYPDAKLAIMGMQLPGYIKGASASEFSGIYQKLADLYQTGLVPFFLEGVAGKRSLNLRDGLHPSEEGYLVIANNVWPVIASLLVANPKTSW
jgi:acyl-CoA thioesterase-1